MARRDHSQSELFRKLLDKYLDHETEIHNQLNVLADEGLLNDARFIENFIAYKRRRGLGPLRIRAELIERGVHEDLIEHHLDITDNAWLNDVRHVWQKRFKNNLPRDFKTRAAQMRFLQYRGFTHQQIDDPKTSVGPVERQVVRLLTPGTVSDAAFLQDNLDNLLVAIHAVQDRFGIATLEMSSGRFHVLEVQGFESLQSELERLKPTELLISEQSSFSLKAPLIRRRPPWEFELETATRLLNQQMRTHDLAGFGCVDMTVAIAAAGCLLQYAKETQRTQLPHIRAIQAERRDEAIILDAATRRNLELTVNLSGGETNTLAAIFDKTATTMGSRLLKRWLNRPLRDRKILNARQASINNLLIDRRYLALHETLRGIGDLERILARVALKSARPRDLIELRSTLE